MSRIAWAQAYPARPVRLIVSLAPAGATDIVARLMGQWLSERLGQPFVIENRPGGGTNIGSRRSVLSGNGQNGFLIERAKQRRRNKAVT